MLLAPLQAHHCLVGWLAYTARSERTVVRTRMPRPTWRPALILLLRATHNRTRTRLKRLTGTLLFDAKYGTRGPPAGPVWLRGLACDGTEPNLLACTYDSVLDAGCSDPYWAAAVMCGGRCQ